MTQKKKFQVFVSSTFTDLQEERQAAVEAILTAGHIPAGMELFAAGDEAQMNVIKRWIDESDVYLLILGGRYGSIEPKSQKSYIHLEYEYALEKGKPLFAVVINKDYLEKRVKKRGTQVVELEHADKLKEFRELVCSKMVRFWNDSKDIKISVLETMADFATRTDLIGWIRVNEAVNIGAIAEEIARRTKSSEVTEPITEKVFLVHGHDEKLLGRTARFIEKLGLEVILLREQPGQGQTIIEKLEHNSNVRFAVVLLTSDDLGKSVRETSELHPRARQNTIFELGYFIGKLGRQNVSILYHESVELPSDYFGIEYIRIDVENAWQLRLAIELRAAGLPVDLNKVVA